ncbi:zinc finger BED domain-containing protein 4-like [Episyrphus balteatus]|uniref:zinc finger BED domain-containing protein 4-like n=1 Tax=Episyrphus balteatus TaxID=286459 RepID=UPI002485824E|nr:zinc finger BED domain-containing protein 4-like [Episyrphus balteatus]
MGGILENWALNEKVMAIVTDNANNAVKAVQSMCQVNEKTNLTCAAHTLQLSVKSSISTEYIKKLIEKTSKLVSHFKHSNVAKYGLGEKQKQMDLPVQTLLQSCNTRWDSLYLMLQRLINNRSPIIQVMADRNLTTSVIAEKLEIIEQDWKSIEELVKILRPIHALTKILSSETASTSMVGMQKILEQHMIESEDDSLTIKSFKEAFSNDLRKRFDLTLISTLQNGGQVSTRQIASLLDPRYKDQEHENFADKIFIRNHLKKILLESEPPIRNANEASSSMTNSDGEFRTELELEETIHTDSHQI